MGVKPDVTACIGNTPLVRLDRFYPPQDGIQIFAKLEYVNPGGSVKDRIGLEMINDAERQGRLKPGGTIIEPTAGNTGIGLALVAAARGYQCICVVPERFAQEKQELLHALGAEVVNTPTKDGMKAAIARARELEASIPGSVVMQHFSNPANPAAHYRTTGPEIWEDMDGVVDAVVLGAGSGGTFTGAVRYLKERNHLLYAVIVQPYGSSLGQGYEGPHKTEGIGIGDPKMVPILDQELIDRMVVVRDEDAQAAVKALARHEGMLVGSSSGAAAHAACLIADELLDGRLELPGGRIVTLFPDSSERYLSKHIYGEFEEWSA